MASITISPYGGTAGTTVSVEVPAASAVDLTETRHVYLAPVKPPPGMPAFGGGAVGAVYEVASFSAADAEHLRFDVPQLGSDPLHGIVPGDYSVVLASAIDSLDAGLFEVLAPGQSLPPPPGADFVYLFPNRPYIPDWRGPYMGDDAPRGYTFWYDAPDHPWTEIQYWEDLANWGTGSWQWVPLPTPPPGWHEEWFADEIHGRRTSLHGFWLAPDDPNNPAPGPPGWPPWPLTPRQTQPAGAPATATLPPLNQQGLTPFAPPSNAAHPNFARIVAWISNVIRKLFGGKGAAPKPQPKPGDDSPPPPTPVTRQGGGKHDVKTIEDISEGGPLLMPDLQGTSDMIWIAQRVLDPDFYLTQQLKLQDFCKQQLKAHSNLEIYVLLWDGKSGIGRWGTNDPPKLKADDFAEPADVSRVHLCISPSGYGVHHQKFILCNREDAKLYCFGYDFQNGDWDAPDHPRVFLPPRSASFFPWHDTAIRVKGQECVDAFEAEFKRRWAKSNGTPALTAATYFNSKASPTGVDTVRPLIQAEGMHFATSPIKQWYLDAIEHAGRYVYIENQYFWDDAILEALIKRYEDRKNLGLPLAVGLVLCPPSLVEPAWFYKKPILTAVLKMRLVTADTLTFRDSTGVETTVSRPAGGWSWVTFQTLDKENDLYLAANAGAVGAAGARPIPPPGTFRFATAGLSGTTVEAKGYLKRAVGGIRVYTMETLGSPGFEAVYVHSKRTIIDDSFTIGSANVDKWSFNFNSEANIVVENAVEAAKLRDSAWANLASGVPQGGDPAVALASLDQAAIANYDLRRQNKPVTSLIMEYPYAPYDQLGPQATW